MTNAHEAIELRAIKQCASGNDVCHANAQSRQKKNTVKQAYKQRRADKHAMQELKRALKMKEPNGCYKNSMNAVFRLPQRLKYLEGFEVLLSGCKTPTCPCYGKTRFNRHAKVLDTVTGIIHEVTPDHKEKVQYVYKAFAKDELMHIHEEDCPIESPDEWEPQLLLQEQHDLLKSAGYDVELLRVLEHCESDDPNCRCGRKKQKCHVPECDCGREKGAHEPDEEHPVDLASIDLRNPWNDIDLYHEHGEGWEYKWQLKTAAAVSAAATNVAAA